MQNILIVDDEKEIAEEMMEFLSSSERDVVTASNGDDALALAEQTRFDIVITDMRMPGMDGATLVRKLNSQFGGETRYLIISGHLDAEQDLITLLDIPYTLLSKPIDIDRLMEAVEG